MIDNSILILFGIAILGMLGAFFLGTWKSQERMFESSKTYEIEAPDDIEVTDEEYEQSLRTRMFNDEQSEQVTG
jgi:hypothetical protein